MHKAVYLTRSIRYFFPKNRGRLKTRKDNIYVVLQFFIFTLEALCEIQVNVLVLR